MAFEDHHSPPASDQDVSELGLGSPLRMSFSDIPPLSLGAMQPTSNATQDISTLPSPTDNPSVVGQRTHDQSDDILAYVDKLKEEQRKLEAPKVSKAIYQDRDGNDFEASHTALSSVSERTEESTVRSLTNSSRSTGSRNMPAVQAIGQHLRIQSSRDRLDEGQRPSGVGSRSPSPTKRGVSPALARRIGNFSSLESQTSSQPGARPLLEPSRSANDLIRFFDNDETTSSASRPVSPSKSVRSASPSDGRGRLRQMPSTASALTDLDLAPTKPLSVSRSATPSSQHKRICTGALLYAPNMDNGWLPCQATLYLDCLIIDYDTPGAPQQLNLPMRELRKVESVRTGHFLSVDGQPVVHGFDIFWRDNSMPTIRLGSKKPAERVQWISRMLCGHCQLLEPSLRSRSDMLEYRSAFSERDSLRSSRSTPSIADTAGAPSSTTGVPGRVPGWEVPPIRSPRPVSMSSKESLLGTQSPTSERGVQTTFDKYGSVVRSAPGLPPVGLKPASIGSATSSASSRSDRSRVVTQAGTIVIKSPPLPPLPLDLGKRTDSRDSKSSTLSSVAPSSFLAAEPRRFALRDPGPTSNAAQITPQKKRGAWSDADRKSVQSDGLLMGAYRPGRAVARDMQKLLKIMERQDTMTLANSPNFRPQLDDMRTQLSSIAARLRSQPYKEEQDSVLSSEEPTLADKVDYMLSLCNILMESHNKMSSQVEKALASKGVIPDESPTSRRRPSDAVALKAAALSRIEDLLQTVLGRLDGSPEDSPEQPLSPVTPKPPAAPEGETTPRALTPQAVSTRTVSSIRTADIEADAAKWRGEAASRELPTPKARPASIGIDEKQRARIDAQRAFTQSKLEGPKIRIEQPNERSRWSATTQDPLGNSRHISSASKPQEAQRPVMQHQATEPDSPISTTSTGTTVPAPRGLFDERTQLIMQGIMNKLEVLAEHNDGTSKHQADVVGYLSRVDDFLREDISSRSSEWQTIVNTLNNVKSAVDALPAQLAALSAAQPSGSQTPQRTSDPPVVADGEATNQEVQQDSSKRKGSLLRKWRGSEPPPGEAGEHGETPRRRSLSMPRVPGPRGMGIRLWGGPTPQAGAPIAGWQRKPKASKKDPTREAEDFQFDTVEAAHAAFADPLSPNLPMPMPMPELPTGGPAGPRMPFVPPVETPAAGMPMPAPGSRPPFVPPVNHEGIHSIQSSIREVLSHLREQAVRDQQRANREEEQARRQQEPSAADRQRELDRKAESIRETAKESKLDALIASLEKRSAEHANLLQKLAQANAPKPEEEKGRKTPSIDEGARVLESIKDGFDSQVRDFKQSLAAEVRTMLAEVGALRDQKKTLQAELAELFAFKAKHGTGAPDLPAYAPPKLDAHGTSAYSTGGGIGGGVFKPTMNMQRDRRAFGPFGARQPPSGGPR